MKQFISKSVWLELSIPFFDLPKDHIVPLENPELLKERANKILDHRFLFFHSIEYNLGKDYDWITNPDSGFKYDIDVHWSKLKEFSEESGDIKFVWEKARFTFLYDLIRYDYHFGRDSSAFVFQQIEDFIDKNPINKGPNYICSQEISIRIFNWAFALNYYKNSKNLSEELFEKIMNSIYWQIDHVYRNINFSRIAVRNNHAITETSILFLSKFLFPFIPETKKWTKKAEKWLIKEIDYQIYPDGSYLQFSHNYHRVVVQVLTWVLVLSRLNNYELDSKIIDRLEKTLDFLYQLQDPVTGWLSNSGNNDGALFFPLNSNHYRDYRPQLQALGLFLGYDLYDKEYEDMYWYGLIKEKQVLKTIEKKTQFGFPYGGYYGFRDRSLTTIRCGTYKDRPSHADALHIDIWHNGRNIFFDPGTYKYNTEYKYIKFYFGTDWHNTLSIGEHDQMLKGKRFIWFFWTKCRESKIEDSRSAFVFKGKIYGFPTVGKKIFHEREVRKIKHHNEWQIIDKTNYKGNEQVILHWNIHPDYLDDVSIQTVGKKNEKLAYFQRKGWYSELYGMKKEFHQLCCIVPDGYAETTIKINL